MGLFGDILKGLTNFTSEALTGSPVISEYNLCGDEEKFYNLCKDMLPYLDAEGDFGDSSSWNIRKGAFMCPDSFKELGRYCGWKRDMSIGLSRDLGNGTTVYYSYYNKGGNFFVGKSCGTTSFMFSFIDRIPKRFDSSMFKYCKGYGVGYCEISFGDTRLERDTSDCFLMKSVGHLSDFESNNLLIKFFDTLIKNEKYDEMPIFYKLKEKINEYIKFLDEKQTEV